MISPDRQLLQQEIYNFLRTVTIKYDPIAQYLNNTLSAKGYAVDDLRPETWKYYLNLVGRYHVSDTLMYVTSLDTRQPILFSPEVLKDNQRTRAVYLPGGAYYNRLCAQYPEQVDLIKSILFPAPDIAKAIQAEDLTLLSYGSGYLEIYEESVIIPEIKNFLEILKERWYFNFLDDEPYFYLTFWSTLWPQLAMLIMSARMENIRTPYVHSWDIWNELEAQGLDNYSDILDREKSILLYQNINYFKANAGKQSNLIILADRLLKSFGIGLYGRMVVQEAETGKDKYQLTPQLVPVRLPSKSQSIPASIETKTVATIQSEIFEKGLTQSNSAEVSRAVERKLGDTTLNEFVTKFLEIKPIAQHKPYAETLNMFLMETLIVSITQDFYSKPVEVRDPLTGNSIYLSPKELLALYNYASLKSLGIEPVGFPTKARFYRSFTPTVKKPKKTIPYMGTTLYLSQHVDTASYLSGLSYDKNIDHPREFTQNVSDLWLRFMDHLLADQGTVLDSRHFAYDYLCSLCHTRREETISLVKGYDTYDDWLGAAGIDLYASVLSQYNIQSDIKVQWANLADKIITTLMPINDILALFGNFTLSDSGYERLRQLFVQMCSYRVVFLESERDTAEFVVGAKWSNAYGPDHAVNYGDFIVNTQISTVDATHLDQGLKLHQGFTVDTITDVYTVSAQTLQTVTEAVSIATTQALDPFTRIIRNPSVQMVQGALNLTITTPVPVMINP